MAGEILVGYDGTTGSKAAAREALRLAKALGAPVVFVFSYSVNPGGGEVADFEAALRERGTAVLQEVLDQAKGLGVETGAELVNDRASAALADVAEQIGAQMIVVGSYGERPLKGALIGSTAHKLLHLSERPVLVVRA